MNIKCLIERIMIICSLILPFFSVCLLWYSIFYLWQMESLAKGFYAASLVIASSSFCQNKWYRISIALMSFFIIAVLFSGIMDGVVILFIPILVGGFSASFIPEHWNKQSWLLLPCLFVRALVAFLGAYVFMCQFNLFDGEFLTGDIIHTLGLTYAILFVVLAFDLFVYCVRRK